MAQVQDVAHYILERESETPDKKVGMTAMKLQKLTYYSKAWHLVWEEQSMFPEAIEAWANGPVCPVLYEKHQGKFQVSPEDVPGNPENLTPEEKSSIDSVLGFYADKSAVELSELTHLESPWKDARGDTPMGARSNVVISEAAMAEYYGGLVG